MNKKVKAQIVEAIKTQQQNYASNAKMAKAIGINASQLSRILKGDHERVLSDAKWISIARRLDVQLKDEPIWQAAKTQTFNFIWSQLEACQNRAVSALLADSADIGKTFTAKQYIKSHKHAVYIDCSQAKSRRDLVKKMAREFGLDAQGRFKDIYADLVFYLRTIENPLIILDEAGDLSYEAFLELKALWNATEGAVGWYMMGADGLKAKIQRRLDSKKVGYAEIMSRFGSRFQRVTPDGKEERDQFIKKQVAAVAQANGATDVKGIYAKTAGSLRRVKIEIQKRKQANA